MNILYFSSSFFNHKTKKLRVNHPAPAIHIHHLLTRNDNFTYRSFGCIFGLKLNTFGGIGNMYLGLLGSNV